MGLKLLELTQSAVLRQDLCIDVIAKVLLKTVDAKVMS